MEKSFHSSRAGGTEANSIIMIVTAIFVLLSLLVPFCLPRKVDEDQLICRTRNWVRSLVVLVAGSTSTSWINFLHGRIWPEDVMDHQHKAAAVHTTQPTQIILPTPTTDLAAALLLLLLIMITIIIWKSWNNVPHTKFVQFWSTTKYNILPTCRHQLCNWTFSFQNSLH